jgi:hypothetical protein
LRHLPETTWGFHRYLGRYVVAVLTVSRRPLRTA